MLAPPEKPRQVQLKHGGTGKNQQLEVYTKMQEEAQKHLHYRDKMDMALSQPQPQQQKFQDQESWNIALR